MIAWRGVVEGDSHPQLLEALHADYTNLHRGLIFDISPACCMTVLYMLPGNRINWLWYRDAPEPRLQGHSVTVTASPEDIQMLHVDADCTWTRSFCDLIKVIALLAPLHCKSNTSSRWQLMTEES